MSFQVDQRILDSSIFIHDGKLSSLYLKKEPRFPWLILVPRIENIQEIYQLNSDAQQILMNEISTLSKNIQEAWHPDKINIGTLGNIVSQLHIHVIGRFQTDPYWPYGIWQPEYETVLHEEGALELFIEKFVPLMRR